MRLSKFIERIIEDGIVASHAEYALDEEKRSGAIAGYESCRNLHPMKLGTLLVMANTALDEARRTHNKRIEEVIAFRAAVEWVCDCTSVVLQNQGMKMLVMPTQMAYAKVADIVGIVPQSRVI